MSRRRRFSPTLIVGLLPVIIIALISLAVVGLYSGISFSLDATPTAIAQAATRTRTPTPTSTSTPTPTSTASPTPTRIRTSTPTPSAGGQVLELTPAANAAGWAASNEPLGNHLGDYNLHSGIYSNTVYYGVFQFDLSAISPGTHIDFATVELAGLNRDRLGTEGQWRLVVLPIDLDQKWSSITFTQLRGAAITNVLEPTLTPSDLAVARFNQFAFRPEQLADLQERLKHGRVSFRLDGPASGPDNLFTWDAGGQAGGLGVKPVLRLGIGPLAPTLTPTYVVVTSTPRPRNAATATAIEATVTFIETNIGTLTPVPANWVTPVMVTATPAPSDVFAAATLSAVMTARARTIGTATPTPLNWVTPIVVTATPTPANAATATYIAALATAQAATTGTATPTPFNVVTATPTPLFVPFTPVPSVTFAAPTPTALPDILKGKIAFLSDRDGTVAAYIMDLDGSNVGRLTSLWPYQFALARDAEANGGAYRVGVIGDVRLGTKIVLFTGQGKQTVLFENSAVNYDPAFAPDGYSIAFVSTLTGRDEIYTISRDRTNFRQITKSDWDFNKHPSWSPDGRRIVWWSNRDTGRRQIWIMNADGSQMVNLSNNMYRDWDPVWIK